jgi:hypothetical protein
MEVDMTQESVIRCPHCGYESTESMPADICEFFYDCKRCGAWLKPKDGDCCVFCSYATVPCPPVRKAAAVVDGLIWFAAKRGLPQVTSRRHAANCRSGLRFRVMPL